MSPRRRLDDPFGGPSSETMGAILGFVIAYVMSGNMVDGIIGGIVAAAIIGTWKWLLNRKRYSNPMTATYEPTLGNHKTQIELPSDALTRVPIRLTISQRLHVERIGWHFTPGPNRPSIVKLFDWENGDGIDNQPLYSNVDVRQHADGEMFWQYKTALLRTKGNTIAVGVLVETKGIYEGYLGITPAYEERAKMPKPLQLRTFVFANKLKAS